MGEEESGKGGITRRKGGGTNEKVARGKEEGHKRKRREKTKKDTKDKIYPNIKGLAALGPASSK